jgi:dTDP-4-amino-4,6-dideoxygalactose transaminase
MFSEYADGPRLERATAFAERHLVLPLSSSTTAERVDTVVTALRDVLAPSS